MLARKIGEAEKGIIEYKNDAVIKTVINNLQKNKLIAPK
jgi:hypothetical protein